MRALRGAEVVQVSDEEGHVFTGESEQDQPLKGPTRKIELRLDPAQYHLDAQAMAAGKRGDVYQSFSVLLRRKPKEVVLFLITLPNIHNFYYEKKQWRGSGEVFTSRSPYHCGASPRRVSPRSA